MVFLTRVACVYSVKEAQVTSAISCSAIVCINIIEPIRGLHVHQYNVCACVKLVFNVCVYVGTCIHSHIYLLLIGEMGD